MKTIETPYAFVDVSRDTLAEAPADIDQRLGNFLVALDTHLCVSTGYNLLSEGLGRQAGGQVAPSTRMLLAGASVNPYRWLEIYDGEYHVLIVSSALDSGQAKKSYLVYSREGISLANVLDMEVYYCTARAPVNSAGELSVSLRDQKGSRNRVSSIDALLAGIPLHNKAPPEPSTLKGLGNS